MNWSFVAGVLVGWLTAFVVALVVAWRAYAWTRRRLAQLDVMKRAAATAAARGGV